jgi:hypothetical protein
VAPRNRLPSPRTLAISAAILAPFAGLWFHGHQRRAEVEQRAGEVASQIAGRSVGVNCPGPIRRHLLYEIHEGTVRFGADGRPADETNVSASTCTGLRRALDEGTRLELGCLAHVCPQKDEQAAAALAVLAHESVHLRGVVDEGKTECEARTHIERVAQAFGLTESAAKALAHWQKTDWAEKLPQRYQSC